MRPGFWKGQRIGCSRGRRRPARERGRGQDANGARVQGAERGDAGRVGRGREKRRGDCRKRFAVGEILRGFDYNNNNNNINEMCERPSTAAATTPLLSAVRPPCARAQRPPEIPARPFVGCGARQSQHRKRPSVLRNIRTG